MRTEDEIKQRKLDLYDSREKLQGIMNESLEKDELILAAHKAVLSVYNACIDQLNWVLNKL